MLVLPTDNQGWILDFMCPRKTLRKGHQNKLLNKTMQNLSAKHDTSEKERRGDRLVPLPYNPPLLTPDNTTENTQS